MTKIILLLAILAGAYAAFVANENKGSFATLHADNEVLDGKITKLKSDNRTETAAVGDAQSALKAIEGTRDEAQARRDYNRSSLARRTKEINTTRTELNGVNTEIREVETILAGSNVPDPDALNSSLEEESTKQVQLQADIDEQASIAESLKVKVNDRRGVLSNLKRTVAESNAAFNKKTRRARVSAVDPEWGFAMINMGDTSGINVNDRVIVERGGQRVGMLVVKDVQSSKVVGNIVPEAGTSGVSPGDSVIFESNTAN